MYHIPFSTWQHVYHQHQIGGPLYPVIKDKSEIDLPIKPRPVKEEDQEDSCSDYDSDENRKKCIKEEKRRFKNFDRLGGGIV